MSVDHTHSLYLFGPEPLIRPLWEAIQCTGEESRMLPHPVTSYTASAHDRMAVKTALMKQEGRIRADLGRPAPFAITEAEALAWLRGEKAPGPEPIVPTEGDVSLVRLLPLLIPQTGARTQPTLDADQPFDAACIHLAQSGSPYARGQIDTLPEGWACVAIHSGWHRRFPPPLFNITGLLGADALPGVVIVETFMNDMNYMRCYAARVGQHMQETRPHYRYPTTVDGDGCEQEDDYPLRIAMAHQDIPEVVLHHLFDGTRAEMRAAYKTRLEHTRALRARQGDRTEPVFTDGETEDIPF